MQSSASEPSRAATATHGAPPPPSPPPVGTQLIFHDECRAEAEARESRHPLPLSGVSRSSIETDPPPPNALLLLTVVRRRRSACEGGGGWAGEEWMAVVACGDHDTSGRAAGNSHLCRGDVKGVARLAPRVAARAGHRGGCAPWRRSQGTIQCVTAVAAPAIPAVVSHPTASCGGLRFPHVLTVDQGYSRGEPVDRLGSD